MQACRVDGRHGRAVPADAAESIAVGADDEIDVRRAQYLAQPQVSAALGGRVVAVRSLGKEPGVPGQLHQVAEKSAGQDLTAGGVLDRPIKVDHQVGAQVRQAPIVVDGLALAHWIAKCLVRGNQLLGGGWHLGGLERDVGVRPGGTQRAVVGVSVSQPGAKVAAHGRAVIPARRPH